MQRHIIVTGASRGLGLALLGRFRALGHTVHGCARNGGEDTALVDVSDAGALERWAESLEAEGCIPDLIINNAAVINEPAPLWEIDPVAFDDLMRINVMGVVHTIRAFLPGMLRLGRGIVVNVSSGWGRSADAGMAPYCASKWAVEGLTQALAEELPPGFAAVSLNPGVINTDMLRTCWPDNAAAYPSPEEWAERSAPFLLGITAKDNGRQLTVPGVPV
ncbi:MAG: SDR family NAD(P)-dependent oxidoreductase [Bacteroidia bacterium]|nr:SDR family NAD(P)-dependent oxidoreductase [Bacteroidia bacterium]